MIIKEKYFIEMGGKVRGSEVIMMTRYNSTLLLLQLSSAPIYDLHCKFDIVWDLVTVPDQYYNHHSEMTDQRNDIFDIKPSQ